MSGNKSIVPPNESTTRRARNNHLTSRVWDHFELQRRPSAAGSSEEATYKAVCKKCGQVMSFDPKHATTTHLLRHIERNICSTRAAASARRRRRPQQQEDEVFVAANDDSQAAAEAFADGVWADGDDDHA